MQCQRINDKERKDILRILLGYFLGSCMHAYVTYPMYIKYLNELSKFDTTQLFNTNTTRINNYGSSNLTRLLNRLDLDRYNFFFNIGLGLKFLLLNPFTLILYFLF